MSKCIGSTKRGLTFAIAVIFAALTVGIAPVLAQELRWGFDFTSGDVGVVDSGTITNDGTGGSQLAGRPDASRGTASYSSDLPLITRLQNTTGTGSVDVSGSDATLETVGAILDLGSEADLISAGGITLQAWYKQTATPPTGIGTLIDLGGTMMITDQGGGFRTFVNSSANPSPFVLVDDFLKQNQWNHVASVFATDGTTNSLSLYLNGILVDEVLNFTGGIPVLDSEAIRKITVGGRGAGPDFNLEGLIFEPVITLGAVDPSNFTTNGAPGLAFTLDLEINRTSGQMTLSNPTLQDVTELIGYTISSSAAVGSLDSSNWTSVTSTYDVNGDGSLDADDQWTVLSGGSSFTDLSEAQLVAGAGLEDGGTVETTDSFNLGNAWIQNPFEDGDIAIEFLLSDGSILPGTVSFVGNGGNSFEVGDLTFDGTITLADWVAFKSVYGTDVSSMSVALAYQNGDLTGDLTSDLEDFVAFETAYDLANGGGSLAAVIAGVPEPSSLALLGLAGLATLLRTRSPRRKTGLNITTSGEKRMIKLNCGLTAFSTKRGLTFAIAVIFAALTVGVAPVLAQELQWGFDFTTGTVASQNGGVIVNDGTGGSSLDGQVALDVPVYSSDIPPTSRTQFVTGTGSVDVSPGGSTAAIQSVGFTPSLGSNADVISAGGLTAEVWVKRLGAGSIESRVWDTGNGWFTLTITDSEIFAISSTGSFPHPIYTLPNNASTDLDNKWVHLAVTYDVEPLDGDDIFSLYLDGEQVSQVIGTANGGLDFPPNLDGGAASRITVGNGSGADRRFNGLVYEPRFTLGVLSPSQFTVVDSFALNLYVNTLTGEAEIRNDSILNNSNIKGYSITSASGSLIAGNWNSLQDQGLDDPTPGDTTNGDGWEELGTAANNELAEAKLFGSSLFGVGDAQSLGNIFGSGFLPADFDLSDTVDAADLAQWEGDFGINGNSDANGDGKSDGADFLAWQRGFGMTSALGTEDLEFTFVFEDGTVGSGTVIYSAGPLGAVAAVPEPNSFALLILAFGSVIFLRRKVSRYHRYTHAAQRSCLTIPTGNREMRSPTACKKPVIGAFVFVALVCGQCTFGAVTNDRDYQLGDDPMEAGVAGQPVGSLSLDSEGPSGAFDDLNVAGNPQYVSVATRPGAGAGDVGIIFDGNGDSLQAPFSLNAPDEFWRNPTFFGPAFDFPLNYERIFSHGIQLWAKPNLPGTGSLQAVVTDTLEQGIAITPANNWGLLFNDTVIDSGVSLSSSVDANGWVHVMQLGGGNDIKKGGSRNGGALLVNGVAVATSTASYGAAETSLAIGSNQAGSGDYYDGTLDDVRVFLWGDNSLQDNGGAGPFGQDYGTLNLGTDNDWIAAKLVELGVTDPADVNLDQSVSGDGTGPAATDDVTAFVENWKSEQVIGGLTVGDWNSRQNGDLNYDGKVDLLDAFILHGGLVAAGLSGLDFSQLGSAIVPEPSTISLLMAAGAALFASRPRRST